ncbi:hypothetical protein BGZ80_008515, partial [Entomortierella chlamydospora]
MLPNKALVASALKVLKKNKDQVTVLLATNTTGTTEKLKPLLIGTAKTPCLWKVRRLTNVQYRNNEGAWIDRRTISSQDWLKKLNNYFENAAGSFN